jgi:hypothetical protein
MPERERGQRERDAEGQDDRPDGDQRRDHRSYREM